MPSLLLFGDYLLSQAVSNQVPSAIRGLTSVFEMGTGVSPVLSSPYSILNNSASTPYLDVSVSDAVDFFRSPSRYALALREIFAYEMLPIASLVGPSHNLNRYFWSNVREISIR